MNKLEAATFLDISVRDLERHMQRGRIAYHFEKGKTRPKVVFDESDIAAFKDEIAASRFAPRVKTRSEPMERVTFRLDSYHLKLLCERANKSGTSPQEAARTLLTQALEGTDELSELRQEFVKLRRHLLQGIHAILHRGGKVSEAEATEFVRLMTRG